MTDTTHPPTQAFPKPPWPLVVTSAVVIGASLWHTSVSIGQLGAGLTREELANPVAILICVAIACFQYLGTFRAKPWTAERIGRLLCFFAVAMILPFLGGVTKTAFDHDAWSWSLAQQAALFAGASGAGSVVIFLFGRLNMRWARQVRDAADDPSVRPARRGFSLRELLGIVAVLGVMLTVGVYVARTTLPRYAQHVAADRAPVALPTGAADVTYAVRGASADAYEFTTDEAAFRDWVASGIGPPAAQAANVQLEEIVQPVWMMGDYRHSAPALTQRDPLKVSDGLIYRWENGDRWVKATFDRQTNRAYYSDNCQ